MADLARGNGEDGEAGGVASHGALDGAEFGFELVGGHVGDANLDSGENGELAGLAFFAQEAGEEALNKAIFLLVGAGRCLDPRIRCHFFDEY